MAPRAPGLFPCLLSTLLNTPPNRLVLLSYQNIAANLIQVIGLLYHVSEIAADIRYLTV